VFLKTTDAAQIQGASRSVAGEPAFSEQLLELGRDGQACSVRYELSLPHGGEYLVRTACDSGQALAGFELLIEGIYTHVLNRGGRGVRRPLDRP
jgi:hypothetical protein